MLKPSAWSRVPPVRYGFTYSSTEAHGAQPFQGSLTVGSYKTTTALYLMECDIVHSVFYQGFQHKNVAREAPEWHVRLSLVLHITLSPM